MHHCRRPCVERSHSGDNEKESPPRRKERKEKAGHFSIALFAPLRRLFLIRAISVIRGCISIGESVQKCVALRTPTILDVRATNNATHFELRATNPATHFQFHLDP
jgi:hypothetical protein